MGDGDMVAGKSWTEFRNAGLIWFVNRILHLFGWAIVVEVGEDGEVFNAYPARVKFRGFCQEVEERGFQRVTKYIKENVDEMLNESLLPTPKKKGGFHN